MVAQRKAVRAGGEERREFVFARIHGFQVNQQQFVWVTISQFFNQVDTVVFDARGADFKNINIRRYLICQCYGLVEIQ